ncbi:MAG: sigma factor-like helix-turn-helix DNA-binding protein, partial [Verrucomicrobiota bacterium]
YKTGRGTICELEKLLRRVSAGEFWPPTGAFTTDQTAELLHLLDTSIATLPNQAHEIMQMRFGLRPTTTLEKAGQRFKLSKEWVRRIETRSLFKIKRATGPKLIFHLRGLARICAASVCPLTPALLTRWMGENTLKLQWSPAAYVHLLGKLCSDIPAWPQGQEPDHISDANNPTIAAIMLALRKSKTALPLPGVYRLACACLGENKPTVRQFLELLKCSHSLLVEFPKPDQGSVRPRRVHIGEAVKAALCASKCALTPEEVQACFMATFSASISLSN